MNWFIHDPWLMLRADVASCFVFDVALLVVLALLARRIAGPVAGVFAGGIWAISPTVLRVSAAGLETPLATLCEIGFVSAWLWARDGHDTAVRRWIVVGALGGLAILAHRCPAARVLRDRTPVVVRQAATAGPVPRGDGGHARTVVGLRDPAVRDTDPAVGTEPRREPVPSGCPRKVGCGGRHQHALRSVRHGDRSAGSARQPLRRCLDGRGVRHPHDGRRARHRGRTAPSTAHGSVGRLGRTRRVRDTGRSAGPGDGVARPGSAGGVVGGDRGLLHLVQRALLHVPVRRPHGCGAGAGRRLCDRARDDTSCRSKGDRPVAGGSDRRSSPPGCSSS